MSEFTLSTFEQAIALYFEPIAREHGLQLVRCGDDAYEIRSPYCVMRLSFHEGGHTRSMNAILSRNAGETSGSNIGVWPIAGYNGVNIKQYIPREKTAEGFFAEAEYVSKMVKTFCVPYLLGEKSDWDQVREYWRKESEKELEKIKGYKFPPNVQKRWHLPPPNDEKPAK
jgi:hypothetical protein